MNFSRQALLGIGMIIGGSVMLYAMVQQIGTNDKPATPAAIVEKSSTEKTTVEPLTTDIETEKRILAQKQKERAARVAEQEKRAQQFLAEQESAEAKALAKSRAENQQYVANSMPAEGEDTEVENSSTVTTPTVQARTDATTNTTNDEKQKAQAAEKEEAKKAAQQAEAKKLADNKKLTEAKERAEAQAKAKKEAEAKKEADAKKKAEEQAAAKQQKQAEEQAAKTAPPTAPADYTVKRGDGLIKLARQYNVPVKALAQANDISSSTSLQVGQELTIPSRKQIERLEREAAAAKKSADARREAQQKLRDARKEVRETDAKGSFGVQVALASNQSSADDVAEKFKSAGYKVKTSVTSRGVRVIVGPERGKVAALALKDKINTDPQVDTSGAWVLYWR
ncbi:LysM peptidoglycan-binding domain-containing protein [Psychrobacter sp. ENNN9_III]|uniref:LysM peptidoglycan-binding domain-containing protein n=1 Tax=Psychrobacter sp. ENNN9_III TaxID=1254334 RepID=UPI00071E8804|nr:LysM peptidoglycan-binding domain-containing protein [Psychrobacter sp. ENNN9_III]